MSSVLDIYDLKQVENLELLANKVVEGFIIGLHKSPYHGFSVEFAEHRLYNQGESTKNIDWKVFARTDKLFVKRYEEETNLRCQIVVDASSSMYFPKDLTIKNLKINKLQFSALAAASLMNLLKKQRDAYGLSLFDEDLKIHTACRSSMTHYNLLMSFLEKQLKVDQLNRQTNTAEILHQIADRVHKRSLVVIFSDFFDTKVNQEDIFAALQHLNYNKHEVVVFHVMDRSLEMEFNFDNRPYHFVDMETGQDVRLQSNALKESYLQKIKKKQDLLTEKCLQYKIDYIPTDIREGFYPLLRNYLIKRSKVAK